MADIKYLHGSQWVPSNKSGYGTECKNKGLIVFKIGGALLECRYNVFDSVVTFCVYQRRSTGWTTILSELGENFDKGDEWTVTKTEKWIESNWELLVQIIDKE